jgi:shikimate dehydrogenase/3-dehydroquinate dehydratase type I
MEIIATYVPIAGRDPRAELATPPPGATMVELRADLLDGSPDLAPLLAACPLPVVVTLRSAAEGGRGADDPARRRDFFARALALDAAFFDLESRDADLLDALVPRERAILSAHPAGTVVAAELEATAAALLAHGTRFAKLVPRAERLEDALAVVRLASACDRGPRAQRRLIVFAAGDAGRATRLLGPLLAAPVAYAAWDDARAAAPGQYTPAELAALAGHLGGRPRRLFAVLGNPVAASLSPRMHAAAYRALALPNLFVPLQVADAVELDALLQPLGETCLDEAGLPAGGFAVTMPWKEEAARRCDLLAPRAQRAAAANTVLPRPGKTLGDCTDIDGINRVLVGSGTAVGGARALVLGTGGAARAAVVALQLAGAEVAVAGRDRGAAEAAARRLEAVAVEVGSGSERAAVVVNATPAGRDGAASPWLEELRAPAGALVIDLPYGDSPTSLEQLAAARGWEYVGGREVLLYQGVAQFAAMNAVAPPVAAMAAALGLAPEAE